LIRSIRVKGEIAKPLRAATKTGPDDELKPCFLKRHADEGVIDPAKPSAGIVRAAPRPSTETMLIEVVAKPLASRQVAPKRAFFWPTPLKDERRSLPRFMTCSTARVIT
jgi:hypothetical protein